MEYNLSDLKKKKVVNILDGKDLGVINDLVFTYPEGNLVAFIVGEKKVFSRCEEYVVHLCCVNKIGDDAVLVSLKNRELDRDE